MPFASQRFAINGVRRGRFEVMKEDTISSGHDSEVTDEDLFVVLESALGDFPNLRRFLPSNYPRGPEFEISLARMHQYSKERGYWHHLNLPLLLHTYRANPGVDVRQLMGSLLKTFDDCAARCGHLPGFKGLLEPLWDNAWGVTPELWSIVSGCYLALCYRAAQIEIIGFEQRIGAGNKLDDIAVRLDGKVTHVEVEAFHKAEFGERSDQAIIDGLIFRADLKAAKFSGITDDEVGVVAVVCVVKKSDVERRQGTPLTVAQIPGQSENIKWMGCRLVGVRFPAGLGFAVMPL